MQMLATPRQGVARFRARLIPVYGLVLSSLLVPSPSWAQQTEAESSEEAEEPVALMASVTGPLTRDITTAFPDAQAYFNQGLQMMYAFTIPNAVESFE